MKMKRSLWIGFAFAAILVLWIGTSSAQESTPVLVQTPIPITQVPTSRPPSSVTPQDLPSLSGVGGTPLVRDVRIRREPSVDARAIGTLRFGRFIDIVGTNGFDPERPCGEDFEADLDMWVQVVFREQRGWVARCTLTIYGDLSRLPIEATPEAVG